MYVRFRKGRNTAYYIRLVLLKTSHEWIEEESSPIIINTHWYFGERIITDWSRIAGQLARISRICRTNMSCYPAGDWECANILNSSPLFITVFKKKHENFRMLGFGDSWVESLDRTEKCARHRNSHREANSGRVICDPRTFIFHLTSF